MPKSKKGNAQSLKTLGSQFHIYCEDEKTEVNYFNACKSAFINEHRKLVVVEKSKVNDPLKLVEFVVDEKDKFPRGDVFWVVYDRENAEQEPDHKYAQAEKLAKKHGINIALSNVCFEQWLLLHFVYSTAAYKSFEDLKKNSPLKNHLAKIGIVNYDKGCADIFKLVNQNDGLNKAIENSEKLEKYMLDRALPGKIAAYQVNPMTQIHLLLKAINDFLGLTN